MNYANNECWISERQKRTWNQEMLLEDENNGLLLSLLPVLKFSCKLPDLLLLILFVLCKQVPAVLKLHGLFWAWRSALAGIWIPKYESYISHKRS